MKNLVIYIHGKGGSTSEADFYRKLFPGCDMRGFDYQSETPWDAKVEFKAYFDEVSRNYENIYLVANSIGAYFAMHALADRKIEKAFFISPVVDMEGLINNMMLWAGVTEAELRERKNIKTDFGETLSIEYLDWVRNNPVCWKTATYIAYGDHDNLQSIDMIRSFAEKTGASVNIMHNGEHWFYSDEQMKFLTEWLLNITRK